MAALNKEMMQAAGFNTAADDWWAGMGFIPLQPLATRCSGPHQASGLTAQQAACRSRHILPYGGKDLVMVYAGFKLLPAETDVTDLTAFHIGIEPEWGVQSSWVDGYLYAGAVIRQVTAGGNFDMSAAPKNLLFTDPVPITVPAAGAIGHRVFIPTSSTATRSRRGLQALGEYGIKGTGLTDQSVGSGNFPTSGGDTVLFVPVSILGKPLDGRRRPSLLIWGDSIDYGTISTSGGSGYDSMDADGNMGWVERSLASKIPFSNFGTPSDGMRFITSTSGGGTGRMRRMRTFAALGYTHCLLKFGANDASSYSADQMIACWKLLASEIQALGMKLIAVTPPPQGGVTNGAASGNGNTAIRDFSAWLRANAVQNFAADRLIDLNALLASSSTPANWNMAIALPNGAPPTWDGTHFSQELTQWLVQQAVLTPGMLAA